MKLLSRNPDKPKKQLETTIGKIIYGFLLFMPLISIMVKCAYVTFNKNAYESYSDDYIYKSYVINNVDSMTAENTYNVVFKQELSGAVNSGNYELYYISYTAEDLGITQETYATITRIQFEGNGNIAFKNDSNYIVTKVYNNENLNFNIRMAPNSVILTRYIVTRNIYAQNKLDNVFEYGIKQTEKSNLYNWAKNTGTYDVLENTTTLLGIENTFIPMLMAYWLLISIIYFIYDIALMLILIVHRKIHELQESI